MNEVHAVKIAWDGIVLRKGFYLELLNHDNNQAMVNDNDWLNSRLQSPVLIKE